MAWSTRELAELAGTALRAVRHHHQVGLLAEPERRSNGYEQYGVAHLVRLLRIERLVDLGFSLPQIAGMDELGDHPAEALRALDADEPTRQAVAERMVPYVRALRARHPDLDEPHAEAPRGPRFAGRTAARAVLDLHDPAQLDVLRRCTALLGEEPGTPPS